MKREIQRFAEFIGWLPLQVALAIMGVVVLGGMARGLGPDLLAWLAELPIYLAFAFAALGISYLAWRRWRMPLDEARKAELWERLMAGERGAVVVYVVNAVFWVAVLWLALDFFRPAR
jgi:TRAP-type C4-dicarboxylate transport system permease small subunit